MRTFWMVSIVVLFMVSSCAAQEPVPSTSLEEISQPPTQEYEISHTPDGPFAARISGVMINEGSTLQRESILLNVPSSPVRIHAAELSFSYRDRRFRYEITTQLEASVLVRALEVRHILYDVFGDHMHNLSNTESVDISPGAIELDGTWNMFQENDLTEHLTTVTYVARARLEDGSVWNADINAISDALESLDLDREIDDEDK